MSNYILAPNGELYHYGVPGMKWGIRKAADLARKSGKFLIKTADRVQKRVDGRSTSSGSRSGQSRQADNKNIDPHKARVEKAKKAVKIGAIAAGAVLAVYGTVKLSKAIEGAAAARGLRDVDALNRMRMAGMGTEYVLQNAEMFKSFDKLYGYR